MKRFILFAFFLCATLAQTLNPEAQNALTNAQITMQQAISAYPKAYPDQPLWKETIDYAKTAVGLAPGQAEPIRFLAEVYSRANWYGPAYQTWMQLMDMGYILDADAIPLFERVAFELGYGAYAQKHRDLALTYFQKIIEIIPYDKEAYVWAGRILLESQRPKEAIHYWQVAVDRDSTDTRSSYFLQLAQDQAKWGIEAANAFREGYNFYEQGDLLQASNRFNVAISKNEMYAEAWGWLGRIAFEQNRFGEAATYYKEALRLEPGNQTYQYFFGQAENKMNQ